MATAKIRVSTKTLSRVLFAAALVYFATIRLQLESNHKVQSYNRYRTMQPISNVAPTNLNPKAQNKNPLDYRLEFLHIPKTGGTLIEVIAKEHGVSWGACKFLPPWRLRPKSKSHLKDCPKLTKPQVPCQESLWHYPIPLLQSKFPSLFRDTENDPYDNLPPDQQLSSPKKKKFFAVVRNPYAWFISLYSMCPPCYRRESLSDYVQAYFQDKSHVNYCQYEFLYNTSSSLGVDEQEGISQHVYSQRIVERDMVVRMESLKDELGALWKRHGYTDWEVPLREERPINEARKTKNKKLSVHNFTKSALEMIHENCRLDFLEGPYQMVDLTDWPQE